MKRWIAGGILDRSLLLHPGYAWDCRLPLLMLATGCHIACLCGLLEVGPEFLRVPPL